MNATRQVLNNLRTAHKDCSDSCALKRLWDEDISEIAEAVDSVKEKAK